jgi:hypothetical protein
MRITNTDSSICFGDSKVFRLRNYDREESFPTGIVGTPTPSPLPPGAIVAPYHTYHYPRAVLATDSLQAGISLAYHTQAASSLHGYHQLRESMIIHPTYQTAAGNLQTSISLAHHTQAASSSPHGYHQLRESMIPQQLMRVVAATPMYGTATRGNMFDPYSVPVMPQFRPWQTARSVASQLLQRPAPGSSNLLYTPGATAPDGQHFPPQHGSLPFPRHQAREPVEARARVIESMRFPTTEAKPREMRRQRRRIPDPLPSRLIRLLSDMESEGNQDIASFTASGRAFQVHQAARVYARRRPALFLPKALQLVH